MIQTFCFIILFCVGIAHGGERLQPDPKLIDAFTKVYNSDSIASDTCLQNLLVLLRSAHKRRVDLQDARVLTIWARGDLLYPQSQRWPRIPYFQYHVVLEKGGFIYDFATQAKDDSPMIYKTDQYFQKMFPHNAVETLSVKVNAAESFLLTGDKKLRMDDNRSFRYIEKVWSQNRHHYVHIALSDSGFVPLPAHFESQQLRCKNALKDSQY